jgi:hypothetical protein
MVDIHFIEFYIKKKYNQKLEEYFEVNKSVSSGWRNKKFPERRLKEFSYREGTLWASTNLSKGNRFIG